MNLLDVIFQIQIKLFLRGRPKIQMIQTYHQKAFVFYMTSGQLLVVLVVYIYCALMDAIPVLVLSLEALLLVL